MAFQTVFKGTVSDTNTYEGLEGNMHSSLYDKLEGCIANLCVEAKAKEIYKAFEGTAEIII